LALNNEQKQIECRTNFVREDIVITR